MFSIHQPPRIFATPREAITKTKFGSVAAPPGRGLPHRIRRGNRAFYYVLFCRNIQIPVIGFAVKTLARIEIFGIKTFQMGEKLKPIVEEQICIFKFSFSLHLNPDDYLHAVGIAEADGARGGAVLDVRRSLTHCVVSLEAERSVDGLIDLALRFK